MNLNAYTLFDSAPITYNRPFFCQSDAEALRHFDDLCADAESLISRHPEHFYLYRTGTFDQNTGAINGEQIQCLATAVDRIAAQRVIEPGSLKESPGGSE